MDEYIKREDAVEAIREKLFTMSMCVSLDECKGMRHAQEMCAKAVECIPAADVRPVVRCKDCVHFQQFRPDCGLCKIDGMLWSNDFFCANGKREEG